MRLISCLIVIAGLLFVAVLVARCYADLQEKLNDRVAEQLEQANNPPEDED